MRSSIRLATSALVLACALAPSSRAEAQKRDPVAAEALFREGRAAAAKQDWPAACAKFEESLRLDPAVGTTFNLADCHEHVGKLASASLLFERVVGELPAGDDRLPVAKSRVAALAKRVPRLTLRLGEGAPPGSTVRRDDVELGAASLGTALPIDPGKHTIAIKAPGRRTRTITVDVGEGERKEVEVLPGAEGEDEGASSSGIGKRTIGFIVGGVGVAGLVTGLATGIVVIGKKSTADEHCPAKRCDPTGYDAVQAGRTLGPVTTAMLVVGLVGVGVGVTLVAIGDEKSKTEAALVPTVGPGSGGLSIVGRW